MGIEKDIKRWRKNPNNMGKEDLVLLIRWQLLSIAYLRKVDPASEAQKELMSPGRTSIAENVEEKPVRRRSSTVIRKQHETSLAEFFNTFPFLEGLEETSFLVEKFKKLATSNKLSEMVVVERNDLWSDLLNNFIKLEKILEELLWPASLLPQAKNILTLILHPEFVLTEREVQIVSNSDSAEQSKEKDIEEGVAGVVSDGEKLFSNNIRSVVRFLKINQQLASYQELSSRCDQLLLDPDSKLDDAMEVQFPGFSPHTAGELHFFDCIKRLNSFSNIYGKLQVLRDGFESNSSSDLRVANLSMLIEKLLTSIRNGVSNLYKQFFLDNRALAEQLNKATTVETQAIETVSPKLNQEGLSEELSLKVLKNEQALANVESFIRERFSMTPSNGECLSEVSNLVGAASNQSEMRVRFAPVPLGQKRHSAFDVELAKVMMQVASQKGDQLPAPPFLTPTPGNQDSSAAELPPPPTPLQADHTDSQSEGVLDVVPGPAGQTNQARARKFSEDFARDRAQSNDLKAKLGDFNQKMDSVIAEVGAEDVKSDLQVVSETSEQAAPADIGNSDNQQEKISSDQQPVGRPSAVEEAKRKIWGNPVTSGSGAPERRPSEDRAREAQDSKFKEKQEQLKSLLSNG